MDKLFNVSKDGEELGRDGSRYEVGQSKIEEAVRYVTTCVPRLIKEVVTDIAVAFVGILPKYP